MSKHTSNYDPNRDTVGAIYRDAQIHNRIEKIECGDMTREIMKSMVDDLNEAIIDGSKEFDGREFYITVHEKKDLQMPSAILRRLIKTLYRPWPEDDTLVFFVHPKSNTIKFCWCLPHWSEMDNMINSQDLYDQDMINQIKAWKVVDLHSFGFVKTFEGHWIPNLNWEDQELGASKNATRLYVPIPIF